MRTLRTKTFTLIALISLTWIAVSPSGASERRGRDGQADETALSQTDRVRFCLLVRLWPVMRCQKTVRNSRNC